MLNRQYLTLALLTGGCLLATNTARAASILWGPNATPAANAQNITGDTDVSTIGSLIGAFNLGELTVPSTTVNGVTFAAFPQTALSNTSGNFTISFTAAAVTNAALGSASTPFSGLSAGYKTLLQSGLAGFNSNITLTMGGLTPGQTYAFEVWSNDSGLNLPFNPNRYDTYVTAGNSVTLRDNISNPLAPGGLGTFAIGTFTANSISQTVTFSGSVDYPVINAFQLRNITIPLPPAAWTGLSTLTALGALKLLRHRKSQS